jgi:hypothetical protein
MSALASAPHVYRAIHAITTAFAKDGIAKTHTNLKDQYQYRSIDDLLGRLGPLLARHRLCILPKVLERTATEQRGDGDALLSAVMVRVAYQLVSCRDGSTHCIEAVGEALDPGDKATAKALSSAYKSAMLQAFCVPVAGADGDASSHRLKVPGRATEPAQGWDAWAKDIIEMIGVCDSIAALDRVRTRQSALLTALRREQPALYATIGEAFGKRGHELAAPAAPSKPAKPTRRGAARETADAEPAPA